MAPLQDTDSIRSDNNPVIDCPLKKKAKICHRSASESGKSLQNRFKHPLGVKPIGNLFEDTANGLVECRTSGLGHLALLQDSLLLSLLNYCSALDLATLAACSRSAYVYGTHDELWRVLVLQEMDGSFIAESTWKLSYLKTKYSNTVSYLPSIHVNGVYSDLLFQSFYCSVAPIEKSWLVVENIERRSAKTMTMADFKANFEGPNKPVIITDAIENWPAMKNWTDEYFIRVCKGKTFYAGGFQFSMDKYLSYCRALRDDQPLFIFDKDFAAKVPQLANDYSVPIYFQEDYFALLGENERPDHRWLIIGPKKAGSSFHIDPNATNAWNSVIRGAKKWIMFPPGQVPPGIHPSDDGSEVSSPVSLMEWFVTFYKDVENLPSHRKPLEGICREGETVFVPHGWWHTVLNIDESIAITQNFVSSGNVRSVFEFITEQPELVSGCPREQRCKLGEMFRDAMAKSAPDMYAKVINDLKTKNERQHRQSKWEKIVTSKPNQEAESTLLTSSIDDVATPKNFTFGFKFE